MIYLISGSLLDIFGESIDLGCAIRNNICFFNGLLSISKFVRSLKPYYLSQKEVLHIYAEAH